MKEHVEESRRAEVAIRDGKAKIARIEDERRKHQAALNGATHQASELRTKAAHAAALAAIGEGSEADARRHDEAATAAEKRVTSITATLAGMETIRASTETAISAARECRVAAVRRAIEAHAAGVIGEYDNAVDAFLSAIRRVRAIDRIRGSVGDNRRLLRSSECMIPAINGGNDQRRLVGMSGTLVYSGELYDKAEQDAATEAELELLSDAGVEV